jgi:chromosome segregation ATPase
MAGEAIELSREKLFETLFIASSTLQELDQERQIRQRFSNAYEELHVLYRRKVEEVHEMATKCFSLHKELEDAQKTISDCDSALKESKRGLAVEKVQFENRLKDLARERARTGQQIQNVLEEEKSARQRVGELEKENGDLAAREALAIQRANELQKYHQAATNIAADQMSSEEMLSKKCKCWQVAAAYTTASPERSPRAAQRRTSERRVRRSNNRNCKGAMKNGDEIQ